MTEAQKRWLRENPERVKAAKRRYAEKHCGEPRKPRPQTCKACGKSFMHPDRKTCSAACESMIASETMSRTNRLYASARMKKNNPMHRGDARERMTATLRRIGHKPKVHGGNGHAMPAPVRRLRELLPDFEPELVILTGKPRGSGYPPAYKADLGNESRKIAVEIDGYSHTSISRKEQDRKKDALLASLGWIVLRFSNAEAAEKPSECADLARSARAC